MLGSATFTMVTSMSSMKLPRHTATSGNHLRMELFSSARLRWARISLHPPIRQLAVPFAQPGVDQVRHASATVPITIRQAGPDPLLQ